ncbi:unnamed protein product [Calypogeia fissa]
MASEWPMETLVNQNLDRSGRRGRLRRKTSLGNSKLGKLEERVRGTLNALKIRVRGERLKYVKSKLEKNYRSLQQQLREVERLSRLRDHNHHQLASSAGTSLVDAAEGETSDDNGGLILLRSRLALFPENSRQPHSTGNISRPQICSKLNPGNFNARKIVSVDIARLEAVSGLPSYTAWMFVDRNERMTIDQSIARRRRISYDSNGGETFFCLDDEEEATVNDDVEKRKETRALTTSEEFISRVAILEHGSGRAVLETISDFVQVSVTTVERLCQSLPAARFGDSNNENRGWQAAASILSASQVFRQPIQYGLRCQLKSNGTLQQDDEHQIRKAIPKTAQANGNANVEPRSNKQGTEMPTSLAFALDSFDTLFCRRCLVFNCALHDCVEEIVVGVNEIQPPTRMLERDQIKPCSLDCRFLVSSSSTILSAIPTADTAAKRGCTSRSEFQLSPHMSYTSETNNKGYRVGRGGGGIQEDHRRLPLNGQLRSGDDDADDNDNEQVSLECAENTALDLSTLDERQLHHSHERKKRLLILKEQHAKKLKKILADEVLTTFGEKEDVLPVKQLTMEDAESSSDSMLYKHEHRTVIVPPLLDGDVFTSFPTNERDHIATTSGDQNDGDTREGTLEPWCSTNGTVLEVQPYGQLQTKLVTERWNRLDQDLCEKGIQIFGKDSCLIAQNVLKGCKSCREIYEYICKQNTVTTVAAGSGDESSSTAHVLSKRGNKFRSMELLHQSGFHTGRVHRPPKFRFGRKKVAPKFALRAVRKRIGTGDGSAGVLNTLYPHYTPCSCESRAGCGKECPCALRNMHCEKYCGCFKVCKNRFRGCQCAKSMCDRRNCPCFAAGRECDPDVCKFCRIDCGHGKNSWQECNNMRILQRQKKRLLLARSDVCTGWGVFTRHPLGKNDYIGEYTGELISHSEADRRGRIYDRETSFLFNLNDKLVVDAFRKGNKLKFANHSSCRANCYAKVLLVGGDHRVGIFAKDKIDAGEELLYDYQYEPEIAPLWATKPG